MSKLCKIALTGGPCGGKSTLLERARAELSARGCTVFAIGETVTEFYHAGFWRGERVGNALFVEATVRAQLAKERLYEDLAGRLEGDAPVVILYDRGIPDARAYFDDFAQFERWLNELGTSYDECLASYDAVVHMVTAAGGAAESYNLDNAARFESAEEAVAVDRRTREQWSAHPRLVTIGNDADGFEGKLARASEVILNMVRL